MNKVYQLKYSSERLGTWLSTCTSDDYIYMRILANEMQNQYGSETTVEIVEMQTNGNVIKKPKTKLTLIKGDKYA